MKAVDLLFTLTTEFLVAHEEQFQPLCSSHAWDGQGASVLVREALGTDVLMKQLFVTAHENDTGTKFLFQERLEDFKHHVEEEWLVYNV